ncbi:DUF4037 domain-containing protein [Paenibacillus sp. TRM 82003]|uniref:DUF4037 domain-containing protein n=1 Tax=Kineococcus sp. TRM81007 TaxID=2925831 RepID=UPI001F595D6F|nr:DUF4037 domain-containing protein [Kineococcus sp. TRM81007]MCI2238654.1 DUF4037 domain-containing protein [Kineococcus sp. TRM81007]MCI3927316.1 DUF4037 domain-containing protein [Paenibacillus sp. TRM 82003]
MTVANGADLARAYWERAVGPLLHRSFPGLPHAAGRLGTGSDVLGLDDATSRDHDWGLRLTLLVPAARVAEVDEFLAAELPEEFAGLPTRFPTTWDPRPAHRVEVADPDAFATARLGVDVTRPWSPADWLVPTGQSVLELTAGPLFADTDGRTTRLRERLARYPDDVQHHVVACDWQRLDQELPFVGRTGQVGDDLGSRVVTARLVRTAVHLGFLLEQRWPPYPKWAGTAFTALPRASVAVPALAAALAAGDWPQRQAALCEALEHLLHLQRTTGLPTTPTATVPFHDRPFRCVDPGLVPAVLGAVRDAAARALPPGVGAVEQWVDAVDVLVDPVRRAAAVRAATGSGDAVPPEHDAPPTG